MKYSTIYFVLIWLASIVGLSGAQNGTSAQQTTTDVGVVIGFFGASKLPEADEGTFLNIIREEFNEFMQAYDSYGKLRANHDTVLVDNEARASLLEITYLHSFEHNVIVDGTEVGYEDFLNFVQLFYFDAAKPTELVNQLRDMIPGTFRNADPALQIQVGSQDDSNGSSSNLGLIGGVAGGAAFVIAAAFFALHLRGKKLRQQREARKRLQLEQRRNNNNNNRDQDGPTNLSSQPSRSGVDPSNGSHSGTDSHRASNNTYELPIQEAIAIPFATVPGEPAAISNDRNEKDAYRTTRSNRNGNQVFTASQESRSSASAGSASQGTASLETEPALRASNRSPGQPKKDPPPRVTPSISEHHQVLDTVRYKDQCQSVILNATPLPQPNEPPKKKAPPKKPPPRTSQREAPRTKIDEESRYEC